MKKIYRTVKVGDVVANTPGEYFGTLQQSITEEWRAHLKTSKYSEHMALNDFYEDMPEKVDALIEAWIACYEKIDEYACNFKAGNLTQLEYLKLLKQFLNAGRDEFLGDPAEYSELHSLLDDCLSLIDSTIYKLRELHEGMISLTDYIKESME